MEKFLTKNITLLCYYHHYNSLIIIIIVQSYYNYIIIILLSITDGICFISSFRSLCESLSAMPRQKNKKEKDNGEEEYSLSCLQRGACF